MVIDFAAERQRRFGMSKGDMFMLVFLSTLVAFAVTPIARRAGVPL
jgi:hypothetical protein